MSGEHVMPLRNQILYYRPVDFLVGAPAGEGAGEVDFHVGWAGILPLRGRLEFLSDEIVPPFLPLLVKQPQSVRGIPNNTAETGCFRLDEQGVFEFRQVETDDIGLAKGPTIGRGLQVNQRVTIRRPYDYACGSVRDGEWGAGNFAIVEAPQPQLPAALRGYRCPVWRERPGRPWSKLLHVSACRLHGE